MAAVPDQGALEFYKLAAQIIPVLWIGSVLQRLDPGPMRRQLRRLDQAADRLYDDAAKLSAEAEKVRLTRHGQELFAGLQQDMAALQKHNEALELTVTSIGHDVDLHRAAPYALIALALAAISEAAALYGVGVSRTGWGLTVVVAAGLVTGGALLLVPLAAGWVRSPWRTSDS
jgi:hypothetical protein